MGEAKRKQSATEKLIAKHPDCFFCGGSRQATTREHMPPKSMFDNSHRPNKFVVPACAECNSGTRTADLAAAIVSRWSYDSGDLERKDQIKLFSRARQQAPTLFAEWTEGLDWPGVRKKKERLRLRQLGVPVPHDACLVTFSTETIKQLNLFAHKAVLALYFEHFQEPLPLAGGVYARFKTKEDFASNGIPEELFQILPRYKTIQQGRWNERETFEYRFDINKSDGLFGCLIKLRKSLYIVGFAATNAANLGAEINGVIHPDDPKKLLNIPWFREK